MAIISQETWDKFTEEEKKKIRKEYKELCNTESQFDVALDTEVYINLFGEENLQPEPEIKVWNDVSSNDWIQKTNVEEFIQNNTDIDNKTVNKILATIQIARLIELGYGGVVSKEEWRDKDLFKWYIVPGIEGKLVIDGSYENWQEFISFHTREQAEEFMSYPENKTLVEQYYLM